MDAKNIYYVASLTEAKITQDMSAGQLFELIKVLATSIHKLADLCSLKTIQPESIEAVQALADVERRQAEAIDAGLARANKPNE